MALTIAALALLALIALLPLLAVLGRPHDGRQRVSAAMALHRAQLSELARERDIGRVTAGDYDAAVLEVQRRLLADDRLAEPPPRVGRRAPIVIACAVLPVAAGALYAVHGHPGLPAEPMAARLAAMRTADPALTDTTIAQARDKLAGEPDGEDARQGLILLGNAEVARGGMAAAAAAWRRAVAIRFEPELAALAAEARVRASGRLDPDSRALFARALAEGAPDAPWRATAEQRLHAPNPS